MLSPFLTEECGFSRSTDRAVHQALLGFDTLFKSAPVEGIVLELARLEAWIATITERLVKERSRGGRRQNTTMILLQTSLPWQKISS